MSKKDIKLIHNLYFCHKMSYYAISKLKNVKYHHRRIKKLVNFIKEMQIPEEDRIFIINRDEILSPHCLEESFKMINKK